MVLPKSDIVRTKTDLVLPRCGVFGKKCVILHLELYMQEEMKKIAVTFSLLAALTFSCGLHGQAEVYRFNKKCGLELNQYLKTLHEEGPVAASKAFGKSKEATTMSLVVRCTDGDAAERELRALGVDCRRISDDVLTARLAPEQIEEVAGWPVVKRVTGLRGRQLHMDRVRESSNVNKVHEGEDLETPFTGENVLICILDQGFQFTHSAFRVTDDSSRIAAVWNLAKSERKLLRTQAEILGSGVDGTRESHGTHVTGIAAGGKLYGSPTYYGVAPGAQIVMVSSADFEDADVLDAISLVKEIAAERHVPWIVNMSFGTNFSPHDGSAELSRDLDELLSKEGAIVASAGNDGDNVLHAAGSFAEGRTVTNIAVDHKSQTYVFVYIVGDGPEPFKAQPAFLNNLSKQFVTADATFWQKYLTEEYGVDSVTNRYYYQAMVNTPAAIKASRYTDCNLAFKVEGTPGHYFHAFLNGNGPVFLADKSQNATIDAMMSVGSPADTRSAVTVGSYVTKNRWTNIEGSNYGYVGAAVVNALSSYSSVGPMTDSTLLKPDVCAPGQGVISSIYKNAVDFAGNNTQIVEKVRMGITDYYYGIMQGTSMSAPVVTGVLALWLEANPLLSAKQIHEIIAESSTRDTWTGTCWNPKWGYGKINAYEGLKLALKRTGIAARHNVTEPVTIRKTGEAWHVLFNADESFADIALCCLDGKVVMHRRVDQVAVGSEQTVDLRGLSAGIYVLKIQTPNRVLSRKVMVK